MKSTRFHLDVPHKRQLANGELVSFSKRTTVTFPVELAELICCLQEVDPHSDGSHAIVREWLQAQIDMSQLWGMSNVSQYLRMQAIRAVALPVLVERSDAFRWNRPK